MMNDERMRLDLDQSLQLLNVSAFLLAGTPTFTWRQIATCQDSLHLIFIIPSLLCPKLCVYLKLTGNKNKYGTMGRNGGGGANGPQYDEIPYGDVPPAQPPVSQMQNGHSGKGELPNVPAEYSQLPNLPQRQGIENSNSLMIHPIGEGRGGGGHQWWSSQ